MAGRQEGGALKIGKHGRPPTLRMIADELGLHVTTVSRVLNGSRAVAESAASADNVARIRRVAQRLGYQPNPHAIGLRTQRSGLVGVMVPRLSDLVLATIYEGIEDAANRHGLATFVTNSHDRPELRRARTTMMLTRRVDGMIFGDADFNARFVDELAEREVPFVLVSRHAGNHPAVTCDDYLGGRLVAAHLAERGHTEVAVVAGEPYASTGLDRTRGFVEGMAEHGVTVPAERVIRSRFDAEGGRAAAERILCTSVPSAIFAVNDFAAIGVLGALRERGLRPGSDVAVVGYNDTPLAMNLPIPLTTVRSPMFRMGQRSVDLLVELIGGHRPASERLAPELIVRASSAPEDDHGD
jgi:LacI family transcriptional regulator, galactose operon repressor